MDYAAKLGPTHSTRTILTAARAAFELAIEIARVFPVHATTFLAKILTIADSMDLT